MASESPTTFTIGRLSKSASVPIETIRFYEQEGLLAPVVRKESGYRLFDETSIRRLHFIREAKTLGFSLKEIRELLGLRVKSKSRCQSVRRKAQEKLDDIHGKIVHLKKLERTLKKLISDCENRVVSDECPILERMEG